MTKDVNVYLMDFPVRGNEMVTENEDGSYTILINARLSDEGRLRAYEHALRHIEANDFEGGNVQDIEKAAHGLASVPIPSSRPQAVRTGRRRRRRKSRWSEYDRNRREFLEQFCLPDSRPGLHTRQVENSMTLDLQKK